MQIMPHEIFTEKITSQYNKFKEKMLVMSKEEIYDNSYTIAKMYELYAFLTEEYQDTEKALPYADNLLNRLADFETGYDTPQWTTWGEIENMLENYIDKENKKRKISGENNVRERYFE